MERIFQKRQFIAITDDTLEWETGYSWDNISAWLRNKRRDTLEAYLKKEISVLPSEMANIERLYGKYDRPIGFDAVRCIEQKENVSRYNLSDYLMDRQSVLAKIRKGREAVNVETEEEELVEEQGAHEEDHNQPDLDYQMNAEQSFKAVDHHEDHVKNRAAEEDNDEELEEEPVDQREPNKMSQEQGEGSVDGQDACEEYHIGPELDYHIDEKHDIGEVKFKNEEIGFNNPQEALFNQELPEQIDEAVADLIAPVNDIKNVERLENLAKEEVVDENEENQLVVFDVIDLGASQDKIQIKEFFCQLFAPGTTRRLVVQVRAGFVLSMFQPDKNKFFDKLNKDGVIINCDQFLIICQEIKKLKDFNRKLAT